MRKLFFSLLLGLIFYSVGIFAEDIPVKSQKNLFGQMSQSMEMELEVDNQLLRDAREKINGIGQAYVISLGSSLPYNVTLNWGIEASTSMQEENTAAMESTEIGLSRGFELASSTDLNTSINYQHILGDSVKESKVQGRFFILVESETEMRSNFKIETSTELSQSMATENSDGVLARSLGFMVSPIIDVQPKISFKMPVESVFEGYYGSVEGGFIEMTITPTVAYQALENLSVDIYASSVALNSDTWVLGDESLSYGATITYGVF